MLLLYSYLITYTLCQYVQTMALQRNLACKAPFNASNSLLNRRVHICGSAKSVINHEVITGKLPIQLPASTHLQSNVCPSQSPRIIRSPLQRTPSLPPSPSSADQHTTHSTAIIHTHPHRILRFHIQLNANLSLNDNTRNQSSGKCQNGIHRSDVGRVLLDAATAIVMGRLLPDTSNPEQSLFSGKLSPI